MWSPPDKIKLLSLLLLQLLFRRSNDLRQHLPRANCHAHVACVANTLNPLYIHRGLTQMV